MASIDKNQDDKQNETVETGNNLTCWRFDRFPIN